MTLKDALLIICGGITVIAILEKTGYADLLDTETSLLASCDDSKRYATTGSGGGIGISVDDAKKMVDKYHEGDTLPLYGVFFSKKATDILFANNPEASGIVAYFGKDESGNLNLILDPAVSTHTEVENGDQPLFIGNSFCPDVCGIYNLKD